MTVEQATREYFENRIFDKGIAEGWIRRPIGFRDPQSLKKKLYEQYFSDDPIAGEIPKGWEAE